uniref:Caspase family p20 domain-containing protein n=1 Tax=Acrobeloides nanus TaxID=290746 RepID=A0A914EB11_9BILA
MCERIDDDGEHHNVTVARELPYYQYEKDRNNIYKNSSKGYVLIINNEKFTYDAKKRKGTEIDERNLRRLFGRDGYGYEIVCKNNRTAEDMMKDAREFANSSMHEEKDSCIVVVLSHGAYDELAGKDHFPIIKDLKKFNEEEFKKKYQLTKQEYCEKFEEFKEAYRLTKEEEYRKKFEKIEKAQDQAQAEKKKTYKPEDWGRVNIHDFLHCFNSENGNAKHLAHKPKLFLFQTCRGRSISSAASALPFSTSSTSPDRPAIQSSSSRPSRTPTSTPGNMSK